MPVYMEMPAPESFGDDVMTRDLHTEVVASDSMIDVRAGAKTPDPTLTRQSDPPSEKTGEAVGLNYTLPGEAEGFHFVKPGEETGLNYTRPGETSGLNYTRPGEAEGFHFVRPGETVGADVPQPDMPGNWGVRVEARP